MFSGNKEQKNCLCLKYNEQIKFNFFIFFVAISFGTSFSFFPFLCVMLQVGLKHKNSLRKLKANMI